VYEKTVFQAGAPGRKHYRPFFICRGRLFLALRHGPP